MRPSTLYDSFNARYLTFQQVADSFIKSDYFDELRRNSHSLLMGPRGCGKTTLLKMLTPPALFQWDKKQHTALFSEIPFIAIYIPSDVQWKKQLDQLKSDLQNNGIVESISRATVNINILIASIKTFSFLIKEWDTLVHTSPVDNRENEFCKLLIDNWRLKKPIVPNLDSLELSLLSEITNINGEIRKLKLGLSSDLADHPMISFGYFDLINFACTAFEKTYDIEGQKNWALCFDELEIAPEWIQMELFEALRSRDQKILFKLTTAPIISLVKKIGEEAPVLNASENNDFSIIKIWTSSQKDFKIWTSFCDQLVKSRISRKYGKSASPFDILGPSDLDRLIVETFRARNFSTEKLSFERDTPTWQITKSLAKNDHSFFRFLLLKGIDPDNPVPRNVNERNEIFRKIRPLVVFRYQFLRERTEAGVVKKRARKNIPLYYGLPLIYELADGNPRILIGMLDELLEIAIKNNDLSELKITEQSRVIANISQKFLAVIASHPDANIIIKNKVVNITEVLITIGNYFHDRMISEEFTMDPQGSFRIDEGINFKLLELIELALFLGAIVSLDDQEPFSRKGIVGRKFRLSYVLAPYFGLLSRDYKEVQLSKILGKDPDPKFQQTLFKK